MVEVHEMTIVLDVSFVEMVSHEIFVDNGGPVFQKTHYLFGLFSDRNRGSFLFLFFDERMLEGIFPTNSFPLVHHQAFRDEIFGQVGN